MKRGRVDAPKNVAWTPRPGWATVRLVGTCADRTLRRGRIVQHTPGEEYVVPGGEGMETETMVIVLHEAARLVEDDLHLIPEQAVVAVGQSLP